VGGTVLHGAVVVTVAGTVAVNVGAAVEQGGSVAVTVPATVAVTVGAGVTVNVMSHGDGVAVTVAAGVTVRVGAAVEQGGSVAVTVAGTVTVTVAGRVGGTVLHGSVVIGGGEHGSYPACAHNARANKRIARIMVLKV